MFDSHSEFLFPRQVVISEDLEYETYKDELITYCLNKKIEDPIGEKFTNINSWQSKEILHDKHLPFIFKSRIIENVFHSLKKELNLYSSVNVLIHRMWIQISQKNSFNITHNHPFSHYSGVFYVKSTNSYHCGTINFHPYCDANDYQSLVFIKKESLMKNNMESSLSYVPKEGTTILFPSGLRHSVGLNETNSDRISIAFDIMFENK